MRSITLSVSPEKQAHPTQFTCNKLLTATHSLQLTTDIKTIEKKLQTNLYSDKDQFIRDMKLIFSNCKEYNQPETLYYKNAEIMEEYI